jgi:hypothetical protein
MRFRCAAKYTSNLHALCNTALNTVLHVFSMCVLMCVFSVRFLCASNLHCQNARFAASSVIGHIFCCTSKIHVIAANRLLHIETAHPKRNQVPLRTRSEKLSCITRGATHVSHMVRYLAILRNMILVATAAHQKKSCCVSSYIYCSRYDGKGN